MKKILISSLAILALSCQSNQDIEGRIECIYKDKLILESNEVINTQDYSLNFKPQEGDYISIEYNIIYYNKEKTESLKNEIKEIQKRLKKSKKFIYYRGV